MRDDDHPFRLRIITFKRLSGGMCLDLHNGTAYDAALGRDTSVLLGHAWGAIGVLEDLVCFVQVYR